MGVRWGWLLALATLLPASAVSASAQLRPYEPIPWEMLTGEPAVHASLGARLLADQSATLAGVRGDLIEAGLLQASVRSGPVLIRVLGAPWRRLQIDQRTGTPAPGTRDPGDQSIAGVGDFSIETMVPLFSAAATTAALRFGTRLPTTDNRIGLERDRIDFHALVGGRHALGGLVASAEVGVGIHGTREAEYEQSDVLVYIGGIEWPGSSLHLGADLVGHADGLPGRSIRGNEELAEARVHATTRGPVRLRLEGIVGFTEVSPAWGVGVHLEALLQ